MGVRRDQFFLGLLAAALITRLLWVIWVHPPGETIFSDMARYTERATLVLNGGAEVGMRSMAWQSWGTHALLALLMKVLGAEQPWMGAGMVWGLFSAAIVVMSYELARQVIDGGERGSRWSQGVGVLALCWYPHLSASGYFLSETPFCLSLLVLSRACVLMWREGRGEGLAALAAAACVALRPQCLLFMALFASWWCVDRLRARHSSARAGQLGFVAMLVLLTLSFSAWRFHTFAGYWGGVAESANMNLTAGRCHNIVTQAFKTQEELERSEVRASTLDGRRVSLPGFRVLAMSGEWHPLSLRPALGEETIRFVGYIGDPQAHAQIRERCYEATGALEQVRYSLVNLSLLWVLNLQWPDAADAGAPDWQRGWAQVFAFIFALGLCVPSLLGALGALRRARDEPGHAICALQLLGLLMLAATFFGTIRVRTPYDPYAFVLAIAWFKQRWLARQN